MKIIKHIKKVKQIALALAFISFSILAMLIELVDEGIITSRSTDLLMEILFVSTIGLLVFRFFYEMNWPRFMNKVPIKNDHQLGKVPLPPVLSNGIKGYMEAYYVDVDFPLFAKEHWVQYETGLPRGLGNFGLNYFIMATPVNVETPHIFIDGLTKNRFLTWHDDMWTLRYILNPKDKMQALEGDFYKYFDVYTPEKDYLSGMTILTPNVMLELRDQGYLFDYEIYDGWLYVIHSARLERDDTDQQMMAAARNVIEKLIPQIAKHSYSESHKELRLRSKNMFSVMFVMQIAWMGWLVLKVLVFVVLAVLVGEILLSLLT